MAWVDPSAPRTVSRLSGVQAVVAEHGSSIAAKARGGLAGHHRTGASRIESERHTPDYLVSLVDRDAAAIEFGGIRRDGRVVPGLFIMTNAAR